MDNSISVTQGIAVVEVRSETGCFADYTIDQNSVSATLSNDGKLDLVFPYHSCPNTSFHTKQVQENPSMGPEKKKPHKV